MPKITVSKGGKNFNGVIILSLNFQAGKEENFLKPDYDILQFS